MGAGDTDAETAAAQLKLIANHYTARAAPRGDVVRMPTTGTARPPHPPLPIDAAVVEHMRAAVAEVVHHTHTVVPDAGPVPAEDAAIYAWMRDNTRDLDTYRRIEAETIIYRQTLEHAIAMGDTDLIHNRHPCPACGCFSLFWRGRRQQAVCVYKRCPGKAHGQSRTWSLAHLAHQHVKTREQSSVRRAT